MIAEVLLVLAGHSSSLFSDEYSLNPAFSSLLHPGEQQCLESLGLIAFRYRTIKARCCNNVSKSRYKCALYATLSQILKNEYETLVIETEAKILRRDAELVASGAFVPLSSIRAIFSEWDAPLAALVTLIRDLETKETWTPGPLIDMLLARSRTGVHRIADIMSRLSVAVQRVWRSQLTAFLVHGSLSSTEPLVSADYTFLNGSIPSCVSEQACDSMGYVGRAVGVIKAAKWHKQLPRTLATDHTALLESVLPEDQHAFDLVITKIRTNVSEWLWLNVLTKKDIEDAVDSLGNYFLLRNGEFSLALLREIERLKLSRLTTRAGSASMIRDQDLNLALLRASLGTSAQHDPTLSLLRFSLPEGPLQPLLPSLSNPSGLAASTSIPQAPPGTTELAMFNSHLLGTPLSLSYTISWPLDLFLDRNDMSVYSALFSFLSSLRKTHIRIHTCWTSLSNAQRARRRWTGLGEGGTAEDLDVRTRLLRCGWGVVRDMEWFLDTLLGYVMMDVVDVEFRKLKEKLEEQVNGPSGNGKESTTGHGLKSKPSKASKSSYLDFTTLRTIHTNYLDRLLTGCLLTNAPLTSILRPILEVCERFIAQVERWGGDVLPALLFEGSLKGGNDEVGAMVKERWLVVGEIDKILHNLLDQFYDQLTMSTSQQPMTMADGSKSYGSVANYSTFNVSRTTKDGNEGDSRRHVERLLLRLDFNGRLSQSVRGKRGHEDILGEGGLGI